MKTKRANTATESGLATECPEMRHLAYMSPGDAWDGVVIVKATCVPVVAAESHFGSNVHGRGNAASVVDNGHTSGEFHWGRASTMALNAGFSSLCTSTVFTARLFPPFFRQVVRCSNPAKSDWHLSGMQFELNDIALRTPAEPSPAPVKEPLAPPENPDAPVREPDPTEPAQI